MCTVSYVPLDNGYVLTSNRDENPARKTKLPNKIQLKKGASIYSPIDVLKGGTWIAMDEKGRTACLLNGAFSKHTPKTTYRKSRGQFVLDAFESDDFASYVASVFLEDIEPFTLLLVEPNQVQKLVWDGTKKHSSQLAPNEEHLWSSATLYEPDAHAMKAAYFTEKINSTGKREDLVLQIHGKDEITPFILNHSSLQTVSITQVIYNQKKSSLNYILKDKSNENSKSISLSCNE